jgi:hypothetical protein
MISCTVISRTVVVATRQLDQPYTVYNRTVYSRLMTVCTLVVVSRTLVVVTSTVGSGQPFMCTAV